MSLHMVMLLRKGKFVIMEIEILSFVVKGSSLCKSNYVTVHLIVHLLENVDKKVQYTEQCAYIKQNKQRKMLIGAL